MRYMGNKSKKIAENYLNLALADLSRILEPVNTRIDTMTIQLLQYEAIENQKFLEHLQQIIAKTGNLLHVKNLYLDMDKGVLCLQFLALFMPKVLEMFSFEEEPDDLNLSELMEMEQFKMAREMSLSLNGILELSDVEKFRNFEKFDMNIQSIDVVGILEIRDWLIGSAHFQSCTIDVEEEIDMDEVSGAIFPIPGSDEVLEFTNDNFSVSIEKKKRSVE